MRHLFEQSAVDELKARLARLTPDSPRQWGRMSPAQMLAHLNVALSHALGEQKPPRMFVGYLFGPIVKRSLLDPAKPMKHNAPTAPELRVRDDRDFDAERRALVERIERFAAGGPGQCTGHPHMFFGPCTPDEWAKLTYKHVDHHLRQFSA